MEKVYCKNCKWFNKNYEMICDKRIPYSNEDKETDYIGLTEIEVYVSKKKENENGECKYYEVKDG